MKNQYYIKEKDLLEHPNPISSDKLETILEQINKCICDIKCPVEGHGTGFFCRIPYPDFFNIKAVLMTNNHILKKDDIAQGKIIKFTMNKEKTQEEIKINNKRKVYTNEEYDVTIIELYPKDDSIKEDSFLDIDPKIECENPNNEFKNKDIYIIGNIKDYTNGKIKNIDDSGINIKHLCSTCRGMSGSPIINLNNFRVIGIHKGAHPNKQYNLGTFLREPLKQFYNDKKKEEIKNDYNNEVNSSHNNEENNNNEKNNNDNKYKKDNFINKKNKMKTYNIDFMNFAPIYNKRSGSNEKSGNVLRIKSSKYLLKIK